MEGEGRKATRASKRHSLRRSRNNETEARARPFKRKEMTRTNEWSDEEGRAREKGVEEGAG